MIEDMIAQSVYQKERALTPPRDYQREMETGNSRFSYPIPDIDIYKGSIDPMQGEVEKKKDPGKDYSCSIGAKYSAIDTKKLLMPALAQYN